MSHPVQLVLGLACAAAGAVLAGVLTFFVGYFSCRVLSWVSGDPQYMGLVYVVWPLSIVAMPFGLMGTGIAFDRLMKRRARRSQAVDGPSGFPVERRK